MPADFADCFFVTMIILKNLSDSIVSANQIIYCLAAMGSFG
jgi:hypothetical protein